MSLPLFLLMLMPLRTLVLILLAVLVLHGRVRLRRLSVVMMVAVLVWVLLIVHHVVVRMRVRAHQRWSHQIAPVHLLRTDRVMQLRSILVLYIRLGLRVLVTVHHLFKTHEIWFRMLCCETCAVFSYYCCGTSLRVYRSRWVETDHISNRHFRGRSIGLWMNFRFILQPKIK